jgi:serine/threonine-protein kinase
MLDRRDDVRERIQTGQYGAEWLSEHSARTPEEIVKDGKTTRAWFAVIDGRDVFVKWYPAERRASWAYIEAVISGAGLHPQIVPLRQTVECADGVLLIFDRVRGESLAPQEVRAQFSRLPQVERTAAVLTASEALAAICEAAFMVVDWYEGNMIYDFDARRLWLFDWELCREGGSFVLTMAANYGSSRLMAPEEFVRGSRLDQKTLVFNLGRYALMTLPDLAEPLAPVLARATYPAPSGRYGTIQEFATALRQAITEAEC